MPVNRKDPQRVDRSSPTQWLTPSLVETLWSRIGGLLYPPRCLVCDQRAAGPEDLCDGCGMDRPRIEPACRRCALPLPPALPHGSLCHRCRRRGPVWRSARAGAPYTAPADTLVLGLKFARRAQDARLLSVWMAASLEEHPLPDPGPDLMVSVPLHRFRLLRRGYDQAQMLARHLSRRLGLPLERPLERVRRTRAQTGLAAAERRRNLAGAFRIRPGHRDRLRGRRILLVDDVLTTGATLEAASRALISAGAESVDVVVAARAEG